MLKNEIFGSYYEIKLPITKNHEYLVRQLLKTQKNGGACDAHIFFNVPHNDVVVMPMERKKSQKNLKTKKNKKKCAPQRLSCPAHDNKKIDINL